MEAPWTADAADLRAYMLFAADFKVRNPAGETYRQLEYIGLASGRAPRAVPGVRETGKPGLNKVLDALQSDFRNAPSNEPRKPDGMGISRDGLRGEIIEVKTVGQRYELKKQLEDELRILQRRVNAVSGVDTRWIGSAWRPVGPDQLYFRPYPHVVVSFEPTYRLNAPPGGILYEVWDRRKQRQESPVALPKDVIDAIRARDDERPVAHEDPAGWAESFARHHPAVVSVLRGLAAVAGAGLCIIAIVLAFDPVPGDEVAAFAAAAALLAFARDGSVPSGYRAVDPA
jgi:hypothetical protein